MCVGGAATDGGKGGTKRRRRCVGYKMSEKSEG